VNERGFHVRYAWGAVGRTRRSDPSTRTGRLRWGISIAIVVLCLAGYGGVLSNGFVAGDDPGYVTENPHVTAGLSASSIRWAFSATDQSNWHPLTWLSHMLDVQLFGVNAGAHHAISLLIHIANSLLVFFLFARLTAELELSAVVASLFAVHPLHVESVAYIAERKDVLSTLFWLLGLWAWLRFLDSRTVGRYGAVLFAYACGLMAKPMLVTFPFTLLLLDVWPLRRVSGTAIPKLLLEKIPLLAMAGASSVLTVIAQRRGGSIQTLADLGIGERVATALVAYSSYLGKTVWPTALSAFYPRPEHGFGMGRVAVAALAFVAITTLVVRLVKRAPYAAVGWFWFVGTLVPVIGLVQVGDQAMADRYTYIPSIGLFAAMTWGIADAFKLRTNARPESRRVWASLSIAVVLALTLWTRQQVSHWSSTIALYQHALDVDPDNYVAHSNLAVALEAAGRRDEAFAHNVRAVEIKPNSSKAHANLGASLAERGQMDDAIGQYEAALRIDPQNVLALSNLGLAMAAQGRVPEAMAKWQEAIRIDPLCADAHANLGVALAQSGRTSEAIQELEATLRINPSHRTALANLATIRAGIAGSSSGDPRH
jgi:Tfp pilus assembly protein PilF